MVGRVHDASQEQAVNDPLSFKDNGSAVHHFGKLGVGDKAAGKGQTTNQDSEQNSHGSKRVNAATVKGCPANQQARRTARSVEERDHLGH